MTAAIEFDVETFATAYVRANQIAQQNDPTQPDFLCAHQIADCIAKRGTLAWDAAVGGAAAYYINGHRF